MKLTDEQILKELDEWVARSEKDIYGNPEYQDYNKGYFEAMYAVRESFKEWKEIK